MPVILYKGLLNSFNEIKIKINKFVLNYNL